jgi:two-component system phosphate regulon sensor histidine kinase PhoR
MRIGSRISPKTALILFLLMVLIVFAQAFWWVMFMARLVAEKLYMAEQLGASPELVDRIHKQEITRQIMVGMEGVFFLALILLGAWLIYRALVRAEELKFHQQNFLSAVTHELKTPLASIKLYLDALDSTKIAEDRKRNVIPRMREDVERLESMVENILDAGRFERSGYHLNKSSFDLSALVTARVDEIGQHPSTIPLSIERKIKPGVQWYGDEAAIGRALDAILGNCLKYHDGLAIKISVKLEVEGERIMLTIADRGIGFEPSEAQAIFDRFYRVGDEMTRSQSGTGLGLYLCREIMRAHGGTVEAYSDGPGQGAKFTITLIRCAQDENDTVS